MAQDNSERSKPPQERGIITLEQHLDSASGAPPQDAPPGAYLLMVHGTTPGRLCRLVSETTVIGRGGGARIFLDDASVSTQHAKLISKGGECWIVDLGSTNGTYVNEERVVGTVALRPGDALKIGSTVFAFLAEGEDPAAHTVSLSQAHSGTLSRTSSLLGPGSATAYTGPTVRPPADPVDGGRLSLLDWIQRVRFAWGLLKRYGWLLVTLGCLGLAAGVAFARNSPPPGAAWFETSLLSEARANPIDNGGGKQQPVIFVAAQNAFRSLPLIKRTLTELGAGDTSDAWASRVQERLSFEPLDRWGKVWRGDYQDTTAESAQAFLKKHLELYLEAEIGKTLALMRAQDELLAKQLDEAKSELTGLENRMSAFREEHPEVMPAILDIQVPLNTEEDGAPKSNGAGNLAAVRGKIAALRAKMHQGDALLAERVKDAQKYRTQIAGVESKIAQARADGLTEQHPRVQKLRAQIQGLQRLAERTVAAKSSDVDKRTNNEFRGMKEELNKLLEAEASIRAKMRMANAEKKEEKPLEKLSLPELETRYREMARQHDNATSLYQALSTKKKSTELQLEIERAAASSRYDIITPPTPLPANTKARMMKFVGLGGVVGAFLAALIAGVMELRVLVRAAERGAVREPLPVTFE